MSIMDRLLGKLGAIIVQSLGNVSTFVHICVDKTFSDRPKSLLQPLPSLSMRGDLQHSRQQLRMVVSKVALVRSQLCALIDKH